MCHLNGNCNKKSDKCLVPLWVKQEYPSCYQIESDELTTLRTTNATLTAQLSRCVEVLEKHNELYEGHMDRCENRCYDCPDLCSRQEEIQTLLDELKEKP